MNEKNKSINEKEIEVLNFWREQEIFKKSLEKPAGENPKGTFTFYDGPPFATGMPHYGHLLAGTIKDAIPRYQTMRGNHVRRVWGWDCHGLPIENMIEKKFNLDSKKDIEEFGIDRFNSEARDSVLMYEDEWKKVIPRFGRFVDMDDPYMTMNPTFTESVWWIFSELDKKGLVFEGYKSMHICPRCETTLAQSEVSEGYKDLTDISVTAKFELEGEPNTYILAWTTTPWTLPGNVALAVNREFDYVKIETESGEKYILAKDRVEEVFKKANLPYKILEELKGEYLINKKYKPVFDYYLDLNIENKENLYKIVDAEFVTLDTGTGVVHIAPAFGEDDLNLSKEKDLPIIKHVGMNGEFTKEVTDFAGMKVKTNKDNQSADIAILKNLSEKKFLFSKEKLIHSYPTCWRCGTPLLNYATSSWFIKVPDIKEKNIAANQKVNWNPQHIKDGRFGKWLEGARDWAVSRSRYWGASMPIWKEEDGDEIKIIGSIKELAENNYDKPKNQYWLMRHGEAIHNVNGIEECGMDPENTLTNLGIAQVEDAKKKNKIDFDIVVSSPFPRTMATAKIMATDKEVIVNQDFREINVGKFNNKPTKDTKDFYGDKYLKFNTKIGGGESHQDVMDRMMKGIMSLEKEYSGKNILIVTHGAPMRMATAGAELYSEEEVIRDELSNDTRLYPRNAEIRKIALKLAPRDEKGRLDLHRPYIDQVILRSKNGNKMKRIEDVFDCWFESGSMPYAQFHYPFENKELFEKNFPADFIAEGLDQTRGWFNSLLNIGVGIFDTSPYKNVIVNGLLLAADGEKMSKSKNNYTDPMLLVEKFGADAFRQTLLATPAMMAENVPFLDVQVEETYKKVVAKLENVLSFYEMIAPQNNLESIDFSEDASKNIIDKWILNRLAEVVNTTTNSMNEYKIADATRLFVGFIDDLSTWWLRRSRERLKDNANSQDYKEALGTLYYVLNEFSKTIAPFMPFLAERVYQTVNKNNTCNQSLHEAANWQRKESVHLESWPKIVSVIEEKILEEMNEVRAIVTELLMIRQKNNIGVRQPLAKAFINKDLPESYKKIIAEEVNIKEVEYGDKNDLDLTITEELKKEGDYRDLVRKIKDLRKENNLTPSDLISLSIKAPQDKLDQIKSFSENLKIECKLSSIDFALGEEQIILKK